jgi:hypothetical protein
VPDDVLAPAAAAEGAGLEAAAEAGPNTANSQTVSHTAADAPSSSAADAEQLQQSLSDSTILPGALAATEEAAASAAAAAVVALTAAVEKEEDQLGHSSALPSSSGVTEQTSMQDGQQTAAPASPAGSPVQQQTHMQQQTHTQASRQACGDAGGSGQAVFGCQHSKRPAVPLAEVLRGVVEHADLKVGFVSSGSGSHWLLCNMPSWVSCTRLRSI